MKKVLALMTMFLAVFALAACGGEEVIDEDQQAVEEAASFLILNDLDRVVSTISLPRAGRNQTTITWSSSNPSVLSADGRVTRPAFGEENVTVTLTATVSRNDASVTKDFTAVVAAFDFELPEAITLAEVAELPLGTVATIRGVITFILGNNAFISDATGGFYLFNIVPSWRSDMVVGNEIIVTGTTADFNGLRQFNANTVATVIVAETGVTPPTPVQLTDVSRDRLNELQGQMVSLDGFFIASRHIPTGTGGFNFNLMNDAGDVVVVRLDSEANLGAGVRNSVLEKLQTLQEGQFVTITNAPLGWHNSSGGQIMISNPNQISGGATLSDQERLDMALETAITIPDADMILENISLPSSIGFGSVVTWTSSNEAVVATDGTVTRPTDGDAEVTLTATVTIGSASETLPEIVVIVKDAAFDPTPLTVSEALEVTSGSVLVEGVVTNILTNLNATIEDENSGIVIRLSSTQLSRLSVGDKVIIEGTRSAFNGLAQIVNQDANYVIQIIESNVDIPESNTIDELDLLENSNWLSFQSRRVNLSGAVVKSIGTVAGNGSFNVMIELPGTEREIALRYEGTLNNEELSNLLLALEVGSVINIQNVTVGWFNNPQLAITDSSQIAAE